MDKSHKCGPEKKKCIYSLKTRRCEGGTNLKSEYYNFF